MIYFDNAATSGNHPDSVIEGLTNAVKYLSVNAGRSAHKLAVNAEEKIYKTRKALCSFFNADKVERVIFTKNCTEALNLAIFGTLKKGGHVITSTFEHNSVLRPLYALEREGLITLTVVKPQRGGFILATDIAKAITPKTYLVCLTAVSNVTGEINDYEAIGALLHSKGILFILDCAQAAGHIILDMKKQNLPIICFSAHKGMNGVQGMGCLIFNEQTVINPIIFGGSGSESFSPIPSGYPELLESGTANLPAIIALYEACLYTKQIFKEKQKYLINLTDYLIEKLKEIKGITLYSSRNPIGIVSFSYKEYFSQEIAGVLSDKFDIAVRGGFHCAPLTHEFLNTKTNGLVRVSLSQFNTPDEIDEFIYAMHNISQYLY